MKKIDRRSLLTGLAAAGVSLASGSAWAQQAKAPSSAARGSQKLTSKLRIVIPANPGGGWDQTGRALGASMVAAGVVDEIEYDQKGGKGGVIGLAHFAEKYLADPNTLCIGGAVMVGAVALHKPVADMEKTLAPLARLTSDYLVMAVPANSPIKNATDLSALMKANMKAVPVAGGSAGGVDHFFAGVFARATGAKAEDLVYLPFAAGSEVASAVLTGKAVVGIAGYSELGAQLQSGELRAIGVSSRKSSFGIPSIRDQGIQIDTANWRGVFTGKGVAPERQAAMTEAVRQATLHESWKSVLKQNRWEGAWLSGKQFNEQVDFDLTTARVLVHLLKLKA